MCNPCSAVEFGSFRHTSNMLKLSGLFFLQYYFLCNKLCYHLEYRGERKNGILGSYLLL